MTKEKQNRILILYSILMQNDKATKNNVLDYLKQNNLIKLSKEDLSLLKTRNEEKWRNELAFTRSHLVREGFLNNKERNFWQILPIGKIYFEELKNEISPLETYQRLTDTFIEKITKSEYILNTEEAKELFEDNTELKNETIEKKIEIVKRYKSIIDKIKIKYDSKCQIENCNFTFKKLNGENYSEGHHLIPLSLGGSQNEDNVVILCPNHHRMMHYANTIIFDKNHNLRKININGEELIIKYKDD